MSKILAVRIMIIIKLMVECTDFGADSYIHVCTYTKQQPIAWCNELKISIAGKLSTKLRGLVMNLGAI